MAATSYIPGTSYLPGTWLGIIRSRTAVLLGPDTPPALVAALWDLLATGPEVHEVLHAVTNSHGGSLANIPSFGLLDFNGPLRVFLRGDLDVTVQSPDGVVQLNGRDVTTWTERPLALPGLCQLTIPAAGGTAHDGLPELPLAEGVVLLQSLLLPEEHGTHGAAATTGAAAVEALAVEALDDDVSVLPEQEVQAHQEVQPQQEVRIHQVPRPARGPAEQEEVAQLPELTAAPEHGASAETVYAVIDEDFEESGAADGVAASAGAVSAGAASDGATRSEGEAPDGPTGSGGIASHGATGLDAAAVQEGSSSDGVTGSTAPVPASDVTSSYDHLWERTVVRTIEDAAVRDDPDADVVEEAEPPADATGSGPAVQGGNPPEEGVDQVPAAAEAAAPYVPAARESGQPSTPPAAGGLIDSVPWRTGGTDSQPAPAAALPPLPAPATPSPVPAAPSPVPATPSPVPAAPSPMLAAVPAAGEAAPAKPAPQAVIGDYDTDHDGQTVIKSQLPGMSPRPAAAVSDASAAGPLVLARVCPQDHANPPTSAHCATCGAALLPDAVQVARPRLGRMRISTGELVDLDQSLVIGRQPSVSRVQGGVMPRLVQVASPGGDISRSHVEVRLEGWHVMLCDLKATNGTVLVREGQAPRRLAQNEMAILLDGDIAELGDNISLRFEEIP
ncbi:hypothetical protein M8J71_05160 [Pseudarthrobacter sp. R1]|uniref:FHA domain-containing protein n=1 Tax=Pseudarthrobacter sp. R1 TaxID=2944934 RepID=UPI00210A1A05|nr:FHA domain-containing protein [Pseudarthrobacter sp. R1]MCQ6269873.1 hypothetical protein [Pseudarthrobacter sp. R1]